MSRTTEFDFKTAYRVAGHEGIAWWADGYDTGYTFEEYEDVEEYTDGEYIEVENRERVKCHMIGDDSTWIFDITDLTPLDEEEYCPSCGQIGCGWH